MKLQILMSTYNGEKYLDAQLDSLLAQTLCEKEGWEVEILVRDDGSKDRTCEILQAYADKDTRIRYIKEENTGVIESFFRLLDNSAKDADYLAFCDQDDVWMPEKMERAVTLLSQAETDRPLLYCGRPLLTDENLNPIETVWSDGQMRPSFGNALIENICTGCTSVMNRALADILRLSHPAFTLMHDRWFYLVASCFGEVIYDTKACIYYRQHGNNTVGMKKNHRQDFVSRLKKYRETRYSITRQTKAFLDFCTEHGLAIPEDKKKCVMDILAMKKHPSARIRLIKNKAVYRQRKGDDLVFKLMLLMGDV